MNQGHIPDAPAQERAARRGFLLLLAGLIGLAYTIFLVSHFGGAIFQSVGADDGSAAQMGEQMGAVLAAGIVAPHMVVTGVSVILNLVAWAVRGKWLALSAAIGYCVAALLFLMYAPFLIPSIVLAFIGFAMLSRRLRRA